MMTCTIKATLLTPCCLSEKPAIGNEVETLDYIPGSALRGLLARAYLIRSESSADERFRRLFVSEELSFPDLQRIGNHRIPLSAHTCKERPGFRNDPRDGDDERPHGVWDLLFEGRDGFSAPACRRRCGAYECGGPLRPLFGWFDGKDLPQRRPGPSRLLTTRTAIAAAGAALDGSLHSQNELAAGSTFEGRLVATSAETPSACHELIEALGGDGAGPLELRGYVGRRRAGELEVSIRPPLPLRLPDDLFLQAWSRPEGPEACEFTITWVSDVILIDDLLRPVVSLDRSGAILKAQCDPEGLLADVPITVEKAFVQSRHVSGWNDVAKIFKADDVAMVRGSTFLVRCPRAAADVVQDWMRATIQRGIGLRRAEGFGRVQFDNPFHRSTARKKGGPL